MEHQLKIDEGERQMVILALAELALSRPGWDDALRTIAQRIDNKGIGSPMYENLKRINRDRAAPCLPLIAQMDEEEIQRWIWGVVNGEPTVAGHFLVDIVHAALHADAYNYPLLRPSLIALKAKYPKYRFEGKL
jgi:hypothetical protein